MKLIVKAKYTRRWVGPDGKWRYEYPKPSKKKRQAKKEEGGQKKKAPPKENKYGFSGNRVEPDQISGAVRRAGKDIRIVHAKDVGKKTLGLGRRLRTPNLGHVFTAEEAEKIVDYILDHPEVQD